MGHRTIIANVMTAKGAKQVAAVLIANRLIASLLPPIPNNFGLRVIFLILHSGQKS